MNKNKHFKTTSFYLAVFLASKGIQLRNIEKTSPTRSSFMFDDSEEVKNTVRAFNFNEEKYLMVNFKQVESAIKNLKRLIYE
jgi:hypothetical protein